MFTVYSALISFDSALPLSSCMKCVRACVCVPRSQEFSIFSKFLALGGEEIKTILTGII